MGAILPCPTAQVNLLKLQKSWLVAFGSMHLLIWNILWNGFDIGGKVKGVGTSFSSGRIKSVLTRAMTQRNHIRLDLCVRYMSAPSRSLYACLRQHLRPIF